MKIVIINPYGTLPDEGWRKYRSTILTEIFSKEGFEVELWISNIDHRSKSKRDVKDYVIDENVTIHVIEAKSYDGNASFSRVRYERDFAKKVYARLMNEQGNIDCFIFTDPCLFYADVLYKLAAKKGSKVVIDILDLWPEVFITLFPYYFRKLIRLLFYPLIRYRRCYLKKSHGIIAATKDYLKIAYFLNDCILKEVVYLGFDKDEITHKIDSRIVKTGNEKWVIYAGTLGLNYDIKTLMSYAHLLENHENYKMFIAGDGPMRKFVVDYIENNGLKHTIYLGRLTSEQLAGYYEKADIALSTYVKSSTVSMPVKAFDCIAYGLPLVNSLERELGDLVVKHGIGLQYEAGNVESLFTQTMKLLNDDVLLMQMKCNTQKLADLFEVSNQYKKYVNLVKKICV